MATLAEKRTFWLDKDWEKVKVISTYARRLVRMCIVCWTSGPNQGHWAHQNHAETGMKGMRWRQINDGTEKLKNPLQFDSTPGNKQKLIEIIQLKRLRRSKRHITYTEPRQSPQSHAQGKRATIANFLIFHLNGTNEKGRWGGIVASIGNQVLKSRSFGQ